MDILDIFLDILLKTPQPFMGLFLFENISRSSPVSIKPETINDTSKIGKSHSYRQYQMN